MFTSASCLAVGARLYLASGWWVVTQTYAYPEFYNGGGSPKVNP